MNKEEYFEISKKNKLTARCPILNYCNRRANTLYLFNNLSEIYPEKSLFESLKYEGLIPNDYSENEIKSQGELPDIINAKYYKIFNNMCPEVSLFDNLNSFTFARGKAITSCDFDSERKYNQLRAVEYKHFSECQEYSTVVFSKKRSVTNSKKRKSLPSTIRFAILERDGFKCKYCGKNSEDGAKLEVDHIIPYSKQGTDELNNLVTSCKDCNLGKSDRIY